MNRHFLAALAILLMASVHAAAQTPSPAAQPKTVKAWVPQRTPDGQVDLQGVWSNATLTPLQRPPELAGKAFFTEAEAAEFEKTRIQRNDQDRPESRRPGEVGAYNQAWMDRGEHVLGTRRTSLVVDPPDGRIPALTSEGKKRLDEAHAYFAQHPADGPEDRPLADRCILWPTAGPPMLPDAYNNYYQIVQSPGYVTILAEMVHDVRVIPLDGRPHLPSNVPQWKGDSRGHWEGNTLVVDTTNFRYADNSRFGQVYDGPTDQNLHVTERFTRTGPNTIVYRATVDDPSAYTKPWTIEITSSKTEQPIYEYACHEGNYAMFGILSGARAEERKAAPGSR